MPKRNDDSTDEHATVLTKKPVGGQSAEDRRTPYASGVRSVDRTGIGIRKSKSPGGEGRRHVQDKECAHAVVAEALPHLREEKSRQPRRVSEEFFLPCRDCAGSYGGYCGFVSHAFMVQVEW